MIYPELKKISVNRDKSVLIATPFYMSQGFSLYFSAVLAATKYLSELKIKWDFVSINGDSYVDRAKNSILQIFRESGYSDLMMIDSDMQFNSSSFLRLALTNYDMVGVMYPTKNGWNRYAGYPIVENGDHVYDENGFIKADVLAGGMVKYSKNCVDKLSEKYADRYYIDETAGYKGKTPVLFENECIEGKRYSEDYSICRKWQSMGGEIWIDPTADIKHYGINGWCGCYLKTRQKEALDNLAEKLDSGIEKLGGK